ncbi:kinase-like domain-containing protein [Rhizophagus clarus]|uniref:Kinase-like domain-containing protein n=1 Tax=Rhizophagus clarus TaxID=94130 RepID=A0A8H3LV38_9GLOM|nr:kinase-like domain-containing protein [Rhizophagus clarus]
MSSQSEDIEYSTYSEHLKNNIINWTSGNKKIDAFIQEVQLGIDKSDGTILEWIPYSQFNEIKEVGRHGFITVYSATWNDGPLYHQWGEYTRASNEKVTLKRLHNLQDPTEFVNEIKKYLARKFDNKVLNIYGITQNISISSDYILVQKNFIWSSGNEKIDEFIQDMQLKVKDYDDAVLEWIPYNQFNEIKEVGRHGFVTVNSATWNDGPLYYQWGGYTRVSNVKVTLKCLHNLQDPIEFVNEIKKYSTGKFGEKVLKVYGISQNLNTNDYILVQKNFTWISGNKEIDDFIQDMQLKVIKDNDDTVLEWIPYDRFSKIEKTSKNSFITVYSAIWNDGPLYYQCGGYTRDSNKEVALKWFHNLQNPVGFIINEVKKYSAKNKSFHMLYGISQNPDTNNYILVFNWTSGNEKIDNFIQEMLFNDKMLEWIPHSQFNEIKEMGKNDLMTVCSAIWKNGRDDEYTSNLNKEVVLKCLHNLQNPVEFVINEIKKYSTGRFGEKFNEIKEMGKNGLMTVYSAIWSDGPLYYQDGEYTRDSNKKVALKCFHTNLQDPIELVINEIKKYSTGKFVLEWIPYNQFNEIKEMRKNGLIAGYSAIWSNGPLYYQDGEYTRASNKKVALRYFRTNLQDPIEFIINEFNEIKEMGKNGLMTVYSAIWSDGLLYYHHGEYIRDPNKEVTFKCLHNSQNSIEFVINEVKKYLTRNFKKEILKIYGISQNPYTNDYILKIGKGGFSTVYSAEWKDGPLEYDADKKMYERHPNRVIALKCLNDSQNITNEFLNEVKEYSIVKGSNILNIYGISQNPDTKDYIMILKYAEIGSFNNWIIANYENFNWQNKLFTLFSIINGLKEIHQKRKVHCDFHAGNILFSSPSIESDVYISDMGLCREVNNADKTNIYGVMPYVAPEVLRGKSYTQAADIYSFGMIMYFVATGRQPFEDRAHDKLLALDICNHGIRPEITEPEAPKCYIDLMYKCWNSNPNNRPNVFEMEVSISQLLKSVYVADNDETEIQFEEAEEYRKAVLLSIKNYQETTHTHPQSIYISRLLNPFTKDLDSECLDYAIS